MFTFLSRALLDLNDRFGRVKAVFSLCALMTILGSVPGARAELGLYAPSIVLHGLAYAVLSLLWFLGSTGSGAMRVAKTVLAIALIGAGDELVQSFMPYRSAELSDWIADITAALLTSVMLAIIVQRREVIRRR